MSLDDSHLQHFFFVTFDGHDETYGQEPKICVLWSIDRTKMYFVFCSKFVCDIYGVKTDQTFHSQ